MSKMSISNSARGVTLTEVLFAVALVSLVLVGALVIFVQTVDVSKKVSFEYGASNIVKNRIERARTFIEISGFSMLTPNEFNETDTILDAGGNPAQDGDFKRSTQVTTNYTGSARLTKIDVTVVYRYRGEWKDSAATTATTIFSDIK